MEQKENQPKINRKMNKKQNCSLIFLILAVSTVCIEGAEDGKVLRDKADKSIALQIFRHSLTKKKESILMEKDILGINWGDLQEISVILCY